MKDLQPPTGVRLWISCKMSEEALKAALASINLDLSKIEKVEVKEKCSFITVSSDVVEAFLAASNQLEVEGRKLAIDRAREPKTSAKSPAKSEAKATAPKPDNRVIKSREPNTLTERTAFLIAMRDGMKAGEAVLVKLLEQERRPDYVKIARFTLKWAKELNVQPRLLFPPTQNTGMRGEDIPEVVARFMDACLTPERGMLYVTMLMEAARTDKLTAMAMKMIQAKADKVFTVDSPTPTVTTTETPQLSLVAKAK